MSLLGTIESISGSKIHIQVSITLPKDAMPLNRTRMVKLDGVIGQESTDDFVYFLDRMVHAKFNISLRNWNRFKGSQSLDSSTKIWAFGSVNIKSLFQERCMSAGYAPDKFTMDGLHAAHGSENPVSFLPRANGFKTDLRCILAPLDYMPYDHLLDRSVKEPSLGKIYDDLVQIQDFQGSAPCQHPTPCEKELMREMEKDLDLDFERDGSEGPSSSLISTTLGSTEIRIRVISDLDPERCEMEAIDLDPSDAPVPKRMRIAQQSGTGQDGITCMASDVKIQNTLYRRRRRIWTEKEKKILLSGMDSRLSWSSLLAELQRNGYNRNSYDCMQEYLCHQKTLAKDPLLPVSFSYHLSKNLAYSINS